MILDSETARKRLSVRSAAANGAAVRTRTVLKLVFIPPPSPRAEPRCYGAGRADQSSAAHSPSARLVGERHRSPTRRGSQTVHVRLRYSESLWPR